MKELVNFQRRRGVVGGTVCVSGCGALVSCGSQDRVQKARTEFRKVDLVEENACMGRRPKIADLGCGPDCCERTRHGLGMGLGMGQGLGNENIFYKRSFPSESLDVTRTHLEVKRLGKNEKSYPQPKA